MAFGEERHTNLNARIKAQDVDIYYIHIYGA
jgi:hypothetical protein